MISRSASQRTNGSRPLSSTNPFRNAALEVPNNNSNDDQQFVDWVRSNAVASPANDGMRVSSPISFTESIREEEEEEEEERKVEDAEDGYGRAQYRESRVRSPVAQVSRNASVKSTPIQHASTNPFLDDLVAEENFSYENQVSMARAKSTNGPTSRQMQYNNNSNYPRDSSNNSTHRYPTARMEKERLRQNYMEHDLRSADAPPPSYEEAAGPRRAKAAFQNEKNSNSSVNRGGMHRYHDREHNQGKSRHRQGSASSVSRDRKAKSKQAAPKNVDTIDKLDVTGLFGGSFHHDGPFDAVTPHRNRNTKAAPVLAFPVDGPNSTIGGASSKPSALNEVFGRDGLDDDDDRIYTLSKKGNRNSTNNSGSTTTLDAIRPRAGDITHFDAKAKELVHGPSTAGLGSTTFLDGAPASTAAIKEDIKNYAHRSRTIGRKKSLSQRLNIGSNNNSSNHRKNNYDRSEPLTLTKTHSGHLEQNTSNEEDVYLGVRFDSDTKKKSAGNKLLRRVKSLKAGKKN